MPRLTTRNQWNRAASYMTLIAIFRVVILVIVGALFALKAMGVHLNLV